MPRHYNIPIFLPELACPHRCVFCNQSSISSTYHIPPAAEVTAIIEKHLNSFKAREKHVELAFFGGNFTGLPQQMQLEYLQHVQPWLKSGQIQGIRLSTRPDYISETQIAWLKNFGVTHIELGAQSTDNEVLQKSGRGHKRDAIEKASAIITEAGLVLGLQMMVGLPGDTVEKMLTTAEDIIRFGAKETRIYPCLVIQDTALQKLFDAGKYKALTLDEAVAQAAKLYLIFENAGVKVLRIGLHTSDDLNGSALIAGPYHPNFAEMVFGKIWLNTFENFNQWPDTTEIIVKTAASQLNHAVGFEASNKKWLLKRFKRVKFMSDSRLHGRQFITQKI